MSRFSGQESSRYAHRRDEVPTVKHFTPSQEPAEGLGVLLIFRLIEEASLKSTKKPFKKDIRILIEFLIDFLTILAPFWDPLGIHLGHFCF